MAYPTQYRIISTALPTECGIAHFNRHLFGALKQRYSSEISLVHTAIGERADYNPELVDVIIDKENDFSWKRGAMLSLLKSMEWQRNNPDAVSAIYLGHEHGLFPRFANEGMINAEGDQNVVISRRAKEDGLLVVSHLHTMLPNPDETQNRTIREMVENSNLVIVPIKEGEEILQRGYSVDLTGEGAPIVGYIPHGVPIRDMDQREQREYKNKLGLNKVGIVTGFQSPDKNHKVAVEAMGLLKKEGNLESKLIVAGGPHPGLLERDKGEKIVEKMEDEVDEILDKYGLSSVRLGPSFDEMNRDNIDKADVVFLKGIVKDEDLLRLNVLADFMYNTTNNPDQVSSGPTSFALGFGVVPISTLAAHSKDTMGLKQLREINFWELRGLAYDASRSEMFPMYDLSSPGMIVQPNEPYQLAYATKMLLEDKVMLERLRRNASMLGVGRSWDNAARQLQEGVDLAHARRLSQK